MIKYVVVAVFSICALPCFAAAQDCGCGGDVVVDTGVSSDCGCGAPEPSCCAPRTRKKLSLTRVQKQVCRRTRVCSTDCCGCPTSKIVRQQKTVCRPKLTLVDAPARERCCRSRNRCSGGCLKGLLSRIGSGGCGGGCGAAADCGCGAAADCGCGAAADCGCDAAPVADCGCGN